MSAIHRYTGLGQQLGRPAVWLLGAALAYGVVTRIFYLLWMADNSPFFTLPVSDAYMYHEWALRIMGGALTSDRAFYQSPGFPYFLGAIYYLFGPDPWPARVAHAVMGVADIALIFVIARRLMEPLWAALAALLAALYFGFAFHESFLLTEALGLHLLLWSLYLALRAAASGRALTWFATGALVGLTALTRSNALLLLPLLGLWLLWQGRRALPRSAGPIAALALGAALTISPATLHNLLIGNEFSLVTTNAGSTFMFGNNPYARGAMALPPGFSGNILTQQQEELDIAQRLLQRPLTHDEAARYWLTHSVKFLFEHPGFALKLGYLKFRRFIGNDEFGSNYSSTYDSNPYRWLMPLPIAVIMGLAAWGLVRAPWREAATQLNVLFMIMTLVTVMLFFMTARYRLPAVPMLIVFAALGLRALTASVAARRWQQGAVSVSVMLFVMLVSFLPLERYDGQAAQWVREAVAWMRQDRPDRALEDFERARRRNPVERGLWLNLGLLHYHARRYDEALAATEKAVTTELDADKPRALALKGVILMDLKRHREAEAPLLQAVSALPFEANIQLAVVRLYYETQRRDAAREQVRRAAAAGVEIPLGIRRALERP